MPLGPVCVGTGLLVFRRPRLEEHLLGLLQLQPYQARFVFWRVTVGFFSLGLSWFS